MSLTPLLRSHGFRKEGSVYLAQYGEMALLVDIQKSRWNDEDDAKFTVNGGIYIPGIVSAYSGRPDPEKPKIADCSLSVRIGMLDELRLDKWWKVTSRDSRQDVVDEEIARELCDRVEMLLLPFLAKFESPAGVAEYLCRDDGYAHAIRRASSTGAAPCLRMPHLLEDGERRQGSTCNRAGTA
ncbi:MAG: DUF4304 domain-containing protein [Planctomycetes bacterium]|nr:DUF4304 domain-containing protein [Planctomycetota bacterium]